jgi:hypothetical protein
MRTSMPWVGFEPTTPVCEQVKAVHALERAVTFIYPTNAKYRKEL